LIFNPIGLSFVTVFGLFFSALLFVVVPPNFIYDIDLAILFKKCSSQKRKHYDNGNGNGTVLQGAL
jgi:hypothetical protein